MVAAGYTKSKSGEMVKNGGSSRRPSAVDRARKTRDNTLGKLIEGEVSRKGLGRARAQRDRTLGRNQPRRFGVVRGGGRGGHSSRGHLRGV